jgi:ABC-type bacteriocin/lantibiotic exporter with double-glycine peptidase domain
MVLEGLSFRLRPGELLAIAGTSGSGKSTLLRLLLGFETPTSGAIYYSGQDLAGLDLRELRRQLGVVLQDGRLMPGTIFDNVSASKNLSREEVWAALENAALAEDVRRMPMGLETVIGLGAESLSGGQRQRLLIARAIASKPRILFFDEATSELDNTTQAAVAEGLAKLDVTRVVIAHRLSTIRHADRVLVLDRGRIVQEGTFESLMEEDGVFRSLAERQM